MTFISRGFLVGLLLTLVACAPGLVSPIPLIPLEPPILEVPASESPAEKFWWACDFKIAWVQNTQPDMAIDLLLAQAVVGPLLESKGERLLFWRFHRRAAPDESGHQFSFLFYADVNVLAEIDAEIQKNPVVLQALKKQIVERAVCDKAGQVSRPEISAMSDAAWSPALQKHWPAFIMGVSRLWLGLINEALAEFPGPEGDFSKRLEQIRKAAVTVNLIWYREGQHAFFHHLSAIFGYEPLLIRKEIRF